MYDKIIEKKSQQMRMMWTSLGRTVILVGKMGIRIEAKRERHCMLRYINQQSFEVVLSKKWYTFQWQ